MTGRSLDTIKRRLREGAFPGARRAGATSNAPWLVPVGDLAAADLLDKPTAATRQERRVCAEERPGETGLLRIIATQAEEIAHLRADLLGALARAEAAEQSLGRFEALLRETLDTRDGAYHE